MNFSAAPTAVSTGGSREETWVVAMDKPKAAGQERLKILVKVSPSADKPHDDGLWFNVKKGDSAEAKAKALCDRAAKFPLKPYTVSCIPGTDVVCIEAKKGYKITKIEGDKFTKANQPNLQFVVSVATIVPS